MTTTVNPITLVYEEIWALLESWKNFTDLVKPGNRVKHLVDDESNKGEVLNADFPEVRISAEGITPDVQISSGSCALSYNFSIEVSTGNKRSDEMLFPLSWEIFRALVGWHTKLTALTWNDAAFVKDLHAVNVLDGRSKRDRDKGIGGWATIWSVTVLMVFSMSVLKDPTV